MINRIVFLLALQVAISANALELSEFVGKYKVEKWNHWAGGSPDFYYFFSQTVQKECNKPETINRYFLTWMSPEEFAKTDNDNLHFPLAVFYQNPGEEALQIPSDGINSFSSDETCIDNGINPNKPPNLISAKVGRNTLYYGYNGMLDPHIKVTFNPNGQIKTSLYDVSMVYWIIIPQWYRSKFSLVQKN